VTDLADFRRFCSELKIEDGAPLELADFQQQMLEDFFGGARETLILISKKNGKSTLLAALALFHLTTTKDAACYIAAASRDQAMVLFDQAAGFVRRNEKLTESVRVLRGYREMRSQVDAGFIRVLAADADTADGVIPTLALVDELHRHKSMGLYTVFRDGLGPRNGQMITISTAGDDEQTPLGEMRTNARQLPGFKTENHHSHVNHDGFVLHEWALAPDEDRDDLKLVKKANPAPWHTVETLRARHDSPSTVPWEWARFACGVWLTGEHSWLDIGAWEACQGDAFIPEGEPVYIGVDVGIKKDSTALLTGWKRPDEKVAVKAKIYKPPEGGHLDLSVVEQEIRNQADLYEVMGVAYDRWSFERSAQMLSDEGLLMIEFPMTNERTVPASARLYEAINSQRIVHDGDPVLAAHVNAGVTSNTERGWRLSKGKPKKPIDALIALLVCFAQVDTAPTGGGFEW